jgi:hypothetical protein
MGDLIAMTSSHLDTIKAIVTYGTIAIVVVGGLAAIVVLNMDPDKLAIVAGLVGAGLSFLSSSESSTRTARQVVAAQTTNGVQTQALRDS